MFSALLTVVLILVVVGVCLWGLLRLPIDATIKEIIKVVVIVVATIWACYVIFGMLSAMPMPHWRHTVH
jgi:hypothetical protein